MRFRTQAEEAEMTTLEKLKVETTDYLTDEHNNQVKGFYEWNGYWRTKEEATKQTCSSGNGLRERLEHLPELFDYMSSITPAMIAEWTKQEGLEGLRRWPYAGRGRYSKDYKYHLSQAGATTKSEAVTKNYAILRRVRWHVGAYLNRLTEAEVKQHVKEIADDELNSTFWNDKGSRYSNAIFRLEICKSWLAGTDHEQKVDVMLGIVSMSWLKSKNIDVTEINNSDYGKAMQELKDADASMTQVKAEHKLVINELEAAIADLRAKVKQHDRDISGMSLTNILKLKGYIEKS